MTKEQLRQVLITFCKLHVNKASGFDGILAIVLRNCVTKLSPVLSSFIACLWVRDKSRKSGSLQMYNLYLRKVVVPSHPIYRPIAIASILCKTTERILNSFLYRYFAANGLLCDRQFGFRSNRSIGDLFVYDTHLCGGAVEKYSESVVSIFRRFKSFNQSVAW